MKVIVRAKARDDLDSIYNWIAKDNPTAALAVVRGIRKRINTLATDELSGMGRPGLIEDTLELLERPYIIVYKIFPRRRELAVLSVIHGARER